MCPITYTIFFLITVAVKVGSLPDQINIGILLHEHQYEHELIFKWSIDLVNSRGSLGRSQLRGIVKKLQEGDSWDAEKKTCELLSSRVVAIIGPTDDQTSQHVGSMCDAFEIPHLSVAPKGLVFSSQATGAGGASNPTFASIYAPSFSSSLTVDLSISRSVLVQAYLSVLHELGWKSFVYLYDRDDSLYEFQQHFEGKSLRSSEFNMKVLRFAQDRPYRDAFWVLKRTKTRHILLDVRCDRLRTVLKHAQQVSMMTELHSYLIICLDTQTLDLEDFKHSRSRIVWLSAFDHSNLARMSLQDLAEDENSSRKINPGIDISPDKLKTESALVHDAIETIVKTLKEVDSSQNIDMSEVVSCKETKPWSYGSSIVNHIRISDDLNGITGRINYDMKGQRTGYELTINRLTEDGPKVVGHWIHSENSSIQMDRKELVYLREGDPGLQEGDQRDLLVVTSLKNEPYFMNKQTTKIVTGNDRFEGYAIDLIEELSRIVGFDYVFKEVDDKKYGKFDIELKAWNGMIREVMIGKADLAIADLSITSDREDAVDFTLPFMNTGISILFKKPTTKELELFSFLSPFENHVWFYVCGAYIGVSSLLFIVGRISPYEWTDPHPCRQEDKILRNQFSVSNSFWFTIAAVMQQGSDLAPRSLSTRLVAAIWYFFTLIMISSYTANLAAFLTVEKVVYPIERAEDLYRHPMHIEYACVGNGSTDTFFSKSKPGSTFNKMYSEMSFVGGNDEGKAAVERGNYAFFMESVSIEYTVERNCNLTQIGGLLDSKGYGIALAKNSTRKRDYRTKLSEAILSLQESGTLEVLKNRWWKEKRGGGACDIDDGQGGEGVKELSLANVGGVFVVLGMGISMSFVLCALELYAKSCKLAVAHGTSKWVQVKRRIRFALSLSENY